MSRVRTSVGRDWAPTPAQVPRLPIPRTAAPGPTGDDAVPAPEVSHEVVRRTGRLRRAVALVVVNALVVASLGIFVGLAIGPRTGNYQTLTMLTGSMSPQFPAGSVVVVTRRPVGELRPGLVITFNAPTADRRVVSHRVVSVDRTGPKPVVVTKGDANAGDDPWRAVINDPYVWQARFAVPLLGDGIRLLRQPDMQLVLTRVLPGLLLLWLLASIWRGDDSSA